MSLSSIQNYGLNNLVNVVRYSRQDDGTGGVVQSDAPTRVYTKRKCRVSRFEDKENQFLQGYDGEKLWTFVFEYSPNIAEGDVVVVPTGTVAPAGNYLIVRCVQRHDHLNRFHHTSIIAEFDE